MAVRRAVLGDAHVDAATAAITPETAAFQDFITRYAWGEIWAREQLSRRERSIATLASLVTGGHEAEIRMHVRAALRNGLTTAEIAEVMLHTALYAGLPAANTALGIAREVFAELDASTDTEDHEENHGG
ncbi:4-carboxymuconolactone decarboxylase [Agromyces albus]|uniref:4-carboxymuconolactone decarboxylase n=2 Tax=Agromyces albus TaxID=205332 RepID=A0A4Q2KVB2_9MICO|nr:carboxymuconolactone decarboxylase family protein [Agromyces albus]RXZ67752.1 4-carboxymuconolactone decarboxylase [Agromyces albus]